MEAIDQQVTFLLGEPAKALGQVFVPILLTNAKNGERFRVVLHAYVLEEMLMGMFISQPSWIEETSFKEDGVEYLCDFGEGNAAKGDVIMLKGVRYE